MTLTETQAENTCALVADLIYAGQFEEAREELGELWQGIGARPELKFTPQVNAEILLQCGTLTGWLGSAKQVDVQEKAKNLITEALEIFQTLNNQIKVAEAQYELGICYWRTGAFDEARIILEKAKQIATHEQRGKILIRQTLVEISTGRYYKALLMLDNARPTFESYPHALKGRWHGQMALVLRKMATKESKTDYYDRAIVEYTAAIFHYEQAGHERHCANNLNNLAFLLYKLGNYQEAHDYLERARIILERVGNLSNLAQVDETRARILAAEKRYQEAELIINGVVRTLEKGGEQALLTDALITQATILARLGNVERSITTFNLAINIGEQAGSECNAGLAAVSLIEEHGKRLSIHAIWKAYRSADRSLLHTQDLDAINRLRGCARIFARRLCERNPKFKLSDAVLEYEGHFIEQALEEEQGSVTRAAKKLGISHQGLASALGRRQQRLFDKRKAPGTRRKSVMKKPAR
ncbi:MAG: tetratricopeptide repeat protein [Pyrinomonadaceae bacterium]